MKRVLVLLREVHHLVHLGFGDFIGEYSAHADALLMHMQHYPGGLLGIHLEKRLQYMDDEFHRGVVVVEQQHLVLAGLLGLGARARGQPDAGSTRVIAISIGACMNAQRGFVVQHHILKIG